VEAGTNIQALAAKAVEEGAERVIAGGGDGTLRAVASALAGTAVPMGILPVGTLNHFARDLEIPLDLAEAAWVAAEGTPVAVDMGEVNGHVFLNNAVIGLYPFYRIQREQLEATGRQRFESVLGAVLKTLQRYPVMTVRIRVNGDEVVKRTPLVIVANNEHAMEGFTPWKRETMTDRILSIYTLRHRHRAGLFRILGKVAVGGKLAEEEFDVLRTREASIEMRWRKLEVSVDGELVPVSSPLLYRSRPGALKVLVPENSRRAQERDAGVEQRL
jgi:diacylglycerol kinase family enzyme